MYYSQSQIVGELIADFVKRNCWTHERAHKHYCVKKKALNE